MEVFLSESAEKKLLILSHYLVEKWNVKTRDRFINKLSNKIQQISLYPYSCEESLSHKGLYKCVVSKQTIFYYRIDMYKNEIEIITFFDARQHPDKLGENL